MKTDRVRLVSVYIYLSAKDRGEYGAKCPEFVGGLVTRPGESGREGEKMKMHQYVKRR